MTEQEAKDLEELKSKVKEVESNTFNYLRSINRYTEIDLLHSGYRNKTNAEAMQSAFRDALKKIEKLHKEYLKKYPD